MKKTAGDIIIFHLCTKNQNHDLQFPWFGAQQTGFFFILDHFLPFYPTTTKKIKILKKWKKPLEILSFYTWCMVPEIWSAMDRIFVIGPFFGLLPSSWPKKSNSEKMKKKTFEDILHKCFKNHDMCLTVPEIQPVTDIIFIFNFGLFSVLLPL